MDKGGQWKSTRHVWEKASIISKYDKFMGIAGIWEKHNGTKHCMIFDVWIRSLILCYSRLHAINCHFKKLHNRFGV